MARTEERVKVMNDIITGIAKRSSYKFLTKDVDEISQELWLAVLKKEESVGYDLDLDLIARICYDKIVDIQRYDERRNTYSLEELYCFEEEEKPDGKSHLKVKLDQSTFETPDNTTRILIDELLNLFPEGTKERIFLEYWSTASGYHDFGLIGNGGQKDGFTESELATKFLGYAGTASGGYKKFRDKMRKFVRDYIEGENRE